MIAAHACQMLMGCHPHRGAGQGLGVLVIAVVLTGVILRWGRR